MVDDNIHPKVSWDCHLDPLALAVLHFNVVFDEPELTVNRFLDHRTAQHFPSSWVLLSQLLTSAFVPWDKSMCPGSFYN